MPMYFLAEIADEHILHTVRLVMDLCGMAESMECADVAFCDEESAEKYVGRMHCVVLYRDRKFPNSKEYERLSDLGEFRILKVPFPIESLMRIAREQGLNVIVEDRVTNETPEPKHSMLRDRISYNGRTVSFGDCSVELTAKEFGLFEYLYKRAGEVVSREELLREVWRRDAESNIVDVYASYLRRKLDLILHPGSLTAVRGLGYVLKI